MNAGPLIREVRSALDLGEESFALLLGLEPTELARLESGSSTPSAELIDELALILGLETDELLHDELQGRATGVLLRSFAVHESTTFQNLLDERLHCSLGKFVRDARRKAWLRQALGGAHAHALGDLRPRPIGPDEHTPFGADRLAEDLRERLGLGVAPIEDMLRLVRERLRVDVCFTTPELLWAQVEGASLHEPYPTILVNLIGGAGAWWRTRMTLAHELCHLLFDAEWLTAGKGLIFSPAPRMPGPDDGHWRPSLASSFDTFLRVEQRANAFAAYFLAPPSGVRALLGPAPDRSVTTAITLAEHYSLHVVSAINVLTNIYKWPRSERSRLIGVATRWRPAAEHPEVDVGEIDADSEALRLAADALALRKINASMYTAWFGDALAEAPGIHVRAGERPPGHWRETTAHEVASAIRTLIQGGGVTPALRVVWDAIGDWLAAQLSGRCGELLDALRPEELDASIVVGLLGATYRARAQIPQRTSFRRAARAALLARGRTPAELDRLLGAQEDTQ